MERQCTSATTNTVQCTIPGTSTQPAARIAGEPTMKDIIVRNHTDREVYLTAFSAVREYTKWKKKNNAVNFYNRVKVRKLHPFSAFIYLFYEVWETKNAIIVEYIGSEQTK